MSRLTRDGTAEPVSRDQTLRHARGQGNYYINFPCSADHEQDWQHSYPVDPYSAICDDHTYIHIYHVTYTTTVTAEQYTVRFVQSKDQRVGAVFFSPLVPVCSLRGE